MMELIEKLNKLCESLDFKYHVNSGGCCYVTYVLATLCENYDIPFKIHVLDDCGCFDPDIFEECISNKCIDCEGLGDCTCCHYFLSIDDARINETEFMNDSDEYIFDCVDSDTMYWIYNTGHWNDCYDTKYNPLIKRTLTSIFNAHFQQRG